MMWGNIEILWSYNDRIWYEIKLNYYDAKRLL
jgi:hypothetical protein